MSERKARAPARTPHRGVRRGVPSGAPDIPEKPIPLLKDGLPMSAFAIMGAGNDPHNWQLPHHSKNITLPGKGNEQTVDWILMETAVTLLSRYGIEGRRVIADPQLIINAANHLAAHHRKAGKTIPVPLCVLITDEL